MDLNLMLYSISVPVLLFTNYLLYRYITWSKLSSIPEPGWKLPLFGHLLRLGSRPHLAITKMQRTCGDIFRLQLGPHPTVVLCGKRVIKTVCSHVKAVGRPHCFFNSWDKHKRYFAFGHDNACLAYRKITMRVLGDFVRSQLPTILNDESPKLIRLLCESNSATEHYEVVRSHLADISYKMCYGRIDHTSQNQSNQIVSCVTKILKFAKQASIADIYPWAKWLPPIKRYYDMFVEAQDSLVKLVEDQERRHVSVENNTSQAVDLCDLFIKSLDHFSGQMPTGKSDIGTLVQQTAMLLIAGMETVSTSLNWATLLLAANPKWQSRIYEELLLENSLAKISPALECFILETLRYSMASPLAMPHMTLDDIFIDGFVIPKRTILIINLWSGSRDTKIWGSDAHQFNPSRFLSSDGQVEKQLSDEILSFGSGRRRCAGELVAKLELVHYLREIIRNCVVELQNPDTNIDYWSNSDGRNQPPVVALKFLKRM